MRAQVLLYGAAIAALVGVVSCGSGATDVCAGGDPSVTTHETAVTLDQIPDDSLIGPLLYWSSGGVPAGTVAKLQEIGIEVTHVFHFQPAILVGGTGAQLREFVAQDTTVEVQFGATVVLPSCKEWT
ncbi:MAG TPA: hypothetical protein VGA37_07095 [Gemmatimonadales bacterium]